MSSSVLRLSRIASAVQRAVSEELRNKLLVTLASPTDTIYRREAVDSITLPGVEGALTVTNNHSQCVTQLKPGVVTVRVVSEQQPKVFFMTNGFLFYKAPTESNPGCCTAEVSAVEVVPIEALDKEAATKMLSEIQASPKETPWDKARAFLAQDLLTSIIRAAASSP